MQNGIRVPQHFRFIIPIIETLKELSSQRGVWTLTEKGMDKQITNDDLLELYEIRKTYRKEYRLNKKKNPEEKNKAKEEEDLPTEEIDYRTTLIEILRSLSPNGFERICQRLLRESGFEQVQVTGRTGDGGIDGIGILQMNPFVSFRVLFQCKRYQGTVSASQVRDFRGAMLGRADKGIILTTGVFSPMQKKRQEGMECPQ